MTGEARPNFRSKGSDRHVRRKARTWFKSCKVIFSLSNVGIEWIVPREYSPGRTVVLVLWKEPTPVNDSLRPYKKWKDQAKERRRWDQGCPMLHARRGLWLFPVQNISWTYTLTDLQRATSNNKIQGICFWEQWRSLRPTVKLVYNIRFLSYTFQTLWIRTKFLCYIM